MSEQCEVVKVKADNEQGFIVINKSDMTKDHIEYIEKPVSKKAKE